MCRLGSTVPLVFDFVTGSGKGVAGLFDARRGPFEVVISSVAGDLCRLNGFTDFIVGSDTRWEWGAGAGVSALGFDKILEKDIGSAALLGFCRSTISSEVNK